MFDENNAKIYYDENILLKEEILKLQTENETFKKDVAKLEHMKHIQKNIPYCIEYNKITKNYYVINRDCEYIGYDNIKCLKNIENDITQNDWIRIYLFNDDNTPWINFKNYLKKFNLQKINNSLNILNNNNFDYDLFC
jgi:hypothetical protein